MRLQQQLATSPSHRSEFWLEPTLAFWLWLAASILVCSFTVAAHWLWAATGIILSTGWTIVLLKRIRQASRSLRSIARDPDLVPHTPLSDLKRRVLAWLPSAIASSLGSAFALMSATFRAPTNATRAYGAEEFLAIGCALMLLLALLSRYWQGLFNLPYLSGWFKDLPESVKPLVKQATTIQTRTPSSTWRSIPDVSREVHYAGIAMAMFDEDEQRPIWQRSTLCLIWYFAPIVVPLAVLLLAPLFFNLVRGLPGLDDESKLMFGVASFVWATWSIAFFVAMGARDFMMPLRYPEGFNRGLLADVISYPNRQVRKVAATFFVGTGTTVLQMLALAIVPAYAGYLGLFGSARAEDASSRTQGQQTANDIKPPFVQVAPPPCQPVHVDPPPTVAATASMPIAASGNQSIRPHVPQTRHRRKKPIACKDGAVTAPAGTPNLQVQQLPPTDPNAMTQIPKLNNTQGDSTLESTESPPKQGK